MADEVEVFGGRYIKFHKNLWDDVVIKEKLLMSDEVDGDVKEVGIKIRGMMGQIQRNSLVNRTIEDWGYYFMRMKVEHPIKEFDEIMKARIKSGNISIRSPIEKPRPAPDKKLKKPFAFKSKIK